MMLLWILKQQFCIFHEIRERWYRRKRAAVRHPIQDPFELMILGHSLNVIAYIKHALDYQK